MVTSLVTDGPTQSVPPGDAPEVPVPGPDLQLSGLSGVQLLTGFLSLRVLLIAFLECVVFIITELCKCRVCSCWFFPGKSSILCFERGVVVRLGDLEGFRDLYKAALKFLVTLDFDL